MGAVTVSFGDIPFRELVGAAEKCRQGGRLPTADDRAEFRPQLGKMPQASGRRSGVSGKALGVERSAKIANEDGFKGTFRSDTGEMIGVGKAFGIEEQLGVSEVAARCSGEVRPGCRHRTRLHPDATWDTEA